MAMQAGVAASTPSLDSMAISPAPPSPGKQFFALEAPSRPPPVLSHLLVNMRAFVGSICSSAHEGVELMFSLYARHERHFLSEFYRVRLNHNGVPAGPKPEDLVGRVQTLFTDLTSRDVAEEIYLVCRIFRTGEAKDVLRPGTSHKDARNSLIGGDLSRTTMGGTHRLQKSSSSIQKSKGSRVSQIFSRSTSPEGETSPTKTATPAHANLSSATVNGIVKGPVYRRPFGCAVLDLSKILHEGVPGPQEGGTDHIMPIFVASQDHDFYQLHDRIIESKTNKLYASHTFAILMIAPKHQRPIVSMSTLNCSTETRSTMSLKPILPSYIPLREPIASGSMMPLFNLAPTSLSRSREPLIAGPF